MIRVRLWVMTGEPQELGKSLFHYCARRMVIADVVQRDLKPATLQIQNELEVFGILQAAPSILSFRDRRQRPYRLRCPHSQFGQQPVDGSDVLDGAEISIVKNGEREFLVIGKAVHEGCARIPIHTPSWWSKCAAG